ncbi:MAG TPA: hypothetical protein HA263_07845 [Methanoregulaceae archaeon]|nr:hypothetical protein [Methanoregulaceae archaeon]
MIPLLTRHHLALALALPDKSHAYVGAGDLTPLLARQERVPLQSAEGVAVGSAYPDNDDMIRFLVWGGSVKPTKSAPGSAEGATCYAASVDLVRALLTMSRIPGVPCTEVEA